MNGRKAKAKRRERRQLALDLVAARLAVDGITAEDVQEATAREVELLASLSDAQFFPIAFALARAIERKANPFRPMVARR